MVDFEIKSYVVLTNDLMDMSLQVANEEPLNSIEEAREFTKGLTCTWAIAEIIEEGNL